MSIELLGITALGNNWYRLDFRDGEANVRFVLELVPRKGIVISREFGHYLDGRASAHEALQALGRFSRGEHVTFPVEVLEDGFTGMGG